MAAEKINEANLVPLDCEDLPVWSMADKGSWYTLVKHPARNDVVEAGDEVADDSAERESPFDVSADINRKIVLWDGDILTLKIDAIVNTTNERLTDNTGLSGRVAFHAGPALAAECSSLEGCPTGDAVITPGFKLPCKNVIHSVGPRYSEKYKTAAENALHGCYRRSLEVLKDNRLTSIAFCVINTERKGYPKKAACHIALRTVRRFLDRYGKDIAKVVFVVPAADAVIRDTYRACMPLYFPRSEQEWLVSGKLLPADIGNEMGEPVSADRVINISQRPAAANDAAAASDSPTPEPTKVVDKMFTQANENPDERRNREDSLKSKDQLAREEETRRYNKYLRMARDEDLTDLAQLNFVYQSGCDGQGRPIICIVASHLPAATADLSRVLLYLIKVLDPLVQNDYNIIYFHTNITSGNRPPLDWLKECYGIFNRKYKKNLKRLFIVHPSMFAKVVLAFVKVFVSAKFWKKVSYTQKLMDLYRDFDPKSLKIPGKILQYDQDEFPHSYTAAYADEEARRTDDGKL